MSCQKSVWLHFRCLVLRSMVNNHIRKVCCPDARWRGKENIHFVSAVWGQDSSLAKTDNTSCRRNLHPVIAFFTGWTSPVFVSAAGVLMLVVANIFEHRCKIPKKEEVLRAWNGCCQTNRRGDGIFSLDKVLRSGFSWVMKGQLYSQIPFLSFRETFSSQGWG